MLNLIFYFSGTGNSLYIAQQLAEKQGTKLVSIAERLINKNLIFVPADGEPVGFVFPVYSWGPPRAVINFIQRVQLARKNNYIFAVCTCANEAGHTMEILRDVMMASRIPLNADFSVTMPNNFIIYSNAPDTALANAIIDKADKDIAIMNDIISKRRSVMLSTKGKFAVIKSNIIYPLFNNFLINPKKFHTTGVCVNCEKCKEVCPMNNISFQDGKPIWGENCTYCLACINRCPQSIVEWGHFTIGKKRYINPKCKF